MQATEPSRTDLRTLSRAGGTDATAVAAPPAVPVPRFPWTTRLIIPGAILLAVLLLLGYVAQDVLWPAQGVRVVPVVVKAGVSDANPSPATGGPSAAPAGGTVQAPGWVEADPYAIGVSALADGVVKEVLALEGQQVKAGDVVARMVDDDAKLSLARAEADLAEKQAALEAAQREWDHPIERVRAVAAADAMVAETQAELDKHHADLAVEEAKLTAAREEFERTNASLEQRASSQIEVIRTRQAFEAQRAMVKAVEAHEAVLKAQLAQRQAELTAAKENLRLRISDAKMLAEARAQVAQAEAMRDEAHLRLSRMEVRSPADGIVMQRLAEPGSKLLLDMDDPRSAQAVRLYDPNRLQVRVDVPLADAAKVGVGQEATIVVGVLPERAFRGKITRVVNEADIQKNTLQVKVAITDPSPELKPEMLARVRFASGAIARSENGANATTQAAFSAGGGGQMVFAPLSLVHRHAGRDATVWVVDPRRSVAVHKSIVLGQHQQDGWIAVAAGLAPGDQLIVAHADELSDGQRIRVIGEADPSNLQLPEGGNHASH